MINLIWTKTRNAVVDFIKNRFNTNRIIQILAIPMMLVKKLTTLNYRLIAPIIREKLLRNCGIKNKIIVTIEGKGILIEDDVVENLPKTL